jgi:hypothetical protein
MAKVKVDEVVDHLSNEMRRALEESVNEVIPGAQFDSHELFRAFKRAVYRKCSTWETVPDQYVQP